MALHWISTVVCVKDSVDVAQYVNDCLPRLRAHRMSITITPHEKSEVSCVEIAITAWSDDIETLRYLEQLHDIWKDLSPGSSYQSSGGNAAETLSNP